MNPNQLKQLEKLSKVFNTSNIISPEDIQEVLKGISLLLADYRKGTVELTEDVKKTFEDVINTISDEHDKVLKEVKNTSETAKSEATEAITKAISEMKRMCAEVMEMKPKDGEKGEDADEEKIIEEVLAKIKLPEYKEVVLDDGAEIISKINDEKVAKINASQIEGLPTFEGKPNGGGWRNLNQLHDVNLSNLANNDVLKYNSTTELWENGVGGGGATAFTDLTDAPSSYSGQAGKAVRVNVGETGLEFFTASGTGTVTSVAATVPTGLTISGSPVTTSGTLAIALDTGYVIPLQTTLDGKANTALSNLASVAINTSLISDTDNTDDLGSALIGWRTGYFSTSILTPKVTADTSAGLLLESANGTDVGLLGSGNTANVEWYGNHNFDTATANTIAIFGASKTLSSADTATYPSLTELSYVKGVTSAIQTQLNAKVDDGAVTTSGLTMATSRILGRTTASTGAIEELTAGSSLSLSAGSLDTIQDIRTTANPQFATIELGAATDTTLSRVSAGVIAVEGVTIATASNTLTLSNKSVSGALNLEENASIALDPSGSADGKYTGITRTGTAGAALAFGDLVYLDPTDSRWELADANAAQGADGDSRGVLGICVLAAAADGDPTTILLYGTVRADTAFPTMTVNNQMYVSETAGDITGTQPTTTDVVIRVVGAALSADELLFNPSPDFITHT